jgi:hypothetical protein
VLKLKVKTEVYSRCSGYFRPVDQWNPGKRSEFADRRKGTFDSNELLVSEQPVLKRENHLTTLQVQTAQL